MNWSWQPGGGVKGVVSAWLEPSVGVVMVVYSV